MSDKHPTAVVTDGDSSMREAIKQVFPNASHRLCAWHLHKNACENVKNSGFLDDFKAAMYSNFTVDQFELFWKRMVAKHSLVGNKWVTKTYENRSLWASAYFRDKFFGRIRTTSQCEAINSLVKAYVNKKDTILEFINRFEHVVREYRNNEMIADFKSLFTQPVLTTSLHKIESEASKLFTLEIFKEVKSEIEVAGALNVNERVDHGDKMIFKMSHYCNRGVEFQVEYDVVNSRFVCECRLRESRGIPCSHIICVLKNENMQAFPSSLIVKRWTKKCKSDLISSYQSEDVDNDVIKEARLGAVGGAIQRLGSIAKEKKEYFNDIIDDVLKLVQKYDSIGEPRDRQASGEKIVKDPPVVKTKGAPPKRKFGRKRRRCSNCNRTGHILNKCPKLYGRGKQKMEDDNEANGSTPLDEVNDDGMELSNHTQRINDNEVEVKISGRHKGKEKECTQDVEVKVSGSHDGKEKECTQNLEVKVSGTHEGKEKECTQQVKVKVSGSHGGKGRESTQKYRPILPNFGNSIYGHGMPGQTMSMPPTMVMLLLTHKVIHLFTPIWLCRTHRRNWYLQYGYGGNSWPHLRSEVKNNGKGEDGKSNDNMKSKD
ncbi:Zinc finger, CCHC-type [Sesbania bispinosa]|nr:Zinc finger, CCHC-type [Sesbania bispinosa]